VSQRNWVGKDCSIISKVPKINPNGNRVRDEESTTWNEVEAANVQACVRPTGPEIERPFVKRPLVPVVMVRKQILQTRRRQCEMLQISYSHFVEGEGSLEQAKFNAKRFRNFKPNKAAFGQLVKHLACLRIDCRSVRYTKARGSRNVPFSEPIYRQDRRNKQHGPIYQPGRGSPTECEAFPQDPRTVRPGSWQASERSDWRNGTKTTARNLDPTPSATCHHQSKIVSPIWHGRLRAAQSPTKEIQVETYALAAIPIEEYPYYMPYARIRYASLQSPQIC
jgi:hypothetical protein